MEDRDLTPLPTPALPTSPQAQPLTLEQHLAPASRLKRSRKPPRWRWLPRFSLLNLLLCTALIALAAAFVTTKTSLQQELRAQQNRLDQAALDNYLRQAFVHADEQIFQSISGCPSLEEIGTIRVLPDRVLGKLPGLVLILDPKKSYVLRGQLEREGKLQINSAVIHRIDSPNPARKVLQLRFSREPLGDIQPPFDPLNTRDETHEALLCRPILLTNTLGTRGTSSRTSGLSPTLPHLEIDKRQKLEDFAESFTQDSELHTNGETVLLKLRGKNAAQAEQTWQLSIREITAEDFKQIAQPQFFQGSEPP